MTTTHRSATASNQPRQKSAEQLAMEAAKRLPAPEPGTVINVKLRILPAYLKLHGIEPTQYRNSVLMVKKIDSPESANPETESTENHEDQ